MAPSRNTIIASTLLITSAWALPQPQASINTAMPILSSDEAASTAPSWWTPSASSSSSASEWDWRVWSATAANGNPTMSAAAITATGVVTSILQTSATASRVSSLAAAQVTSSASASYENPFTVYTSMTDSRGVITGMPAVATSQPSQAAVASVCSGCSSVMSAESSWSSMVASLYSTSTKAAVVSVNATGTLSSATRSSTSSATGSAFVQQSTGGASKDMVGAGIMLVAIAALL